MASELITLLEQEAAGERDRVLTEARRQADEIRGAARAEAQRLVGAQREHQEAALRAARVRAQSTAQLQAQALLLQQKDQMIAEVFRRAEEALDQAVRDRNQYDRVLERLLAEGMQGIRGHVVIEAHPDDVALARSAAQRQRLDAEVRPADGVRGGVRLVSSNDRYTVLNTLTSRLERARPTLASEVASILWG